VHILGYGIDPQHAGLGALIDALTTGRNDRSPKIIARLKALGMDLCMDEVDRLVGNGTAGRPHIAQLMVQKNMASSIDDAFDRFLGKNQPAYVDKYRAPMDAAIDAINAAGGMAVLAHPFLNELNDMAVFESFLLTLKSMGLGGIEAIYPDHPQAATDLYCRLAQKHDLLITGGTDFHGQVTPGIQMGVGDGSLHVPYSIYEALAARLEH
jgi:predicted metal-dependent phosphoesterase TrpH